jgi:hypothetical protein
MQNSERPRNKKIHQKKNRNSAFLQYQQKKKKKLQKEKTE